MLVRLKDQRLLPTFAVLMLSQAGIRDTLSLQSVGATMDNLNTHILAKLRFPLPPPDEQVAILAFLGREMAKIDRLIEVRRKQVERLQEQRTAVIHHAVTKGLNPSVSMRPSAMRWLGNIPADWRCVRLGVVASVKARLGWKGLTASEYIDSGNYFLSTPEIKSSEIAFGNASFITDERYFESPEIMLQVGDVLLVKDGATLGIVNVVRHLPGPTTVNGSIAVIRIKHYLLPSFLAYYFRSQYFQNIIQEVKGGMGVPHLFQSDIVKFKVLIPSSKEQSTIVTYLDQETEKIDKLVAKYRREVELLAEYRASLISHAVTGKIDVRSLVNDDNRLELAASV